MFSKGKADLNRSAVRKSYGKPNFCVMFFVIYLLILLCYLKQMKKIKYCKLLFIEVFKLI